MISPSPITFTKRMEENKMNYYLGFDAGTQSVNASQSMMRNMNLHRIIFRTDQTLNLSMNQAG